MTYELIKSILDELGIQYAYYEFNGPIKVSRYIAYYEDTKNRFLADDKVYAWDHHFIIELYTKHKDPDTEQKLIDLFEKHDVAWSGGETTYINSEKVFMTVFYC